MSHQYTYNLKKLSQEDQQARYDVILKFVNFNAYFAYLPYINNPTNNYYKYSNSDLNTILLTIQYGNIDDQSEHIKKLYADFVKDYQFNMETYVREEQEKLVRLQEQQYAAQQYAALQYNASTQPVAFNAGQQNYGQQQQYPAQQYQQYPQQQQQYGGYEQQGYQNRTNYRGEGRDGRKQYNNREQNQYNQPREHQSRGEYQPREHHYRENNQQQQNYEYGQQQTHKRREFHEKKGPEQHAQHAEHHSHPNHEEHHLWHKFHTKAGDIIGFESKAEYDEFARFKEKYGLDIKIKFDPLAIFESETKLLEEDEPAPEPVPEPVPEVIPEPVVVVPEPKPEPKPKKFSIEEIKQFINSVSKEELEKHVNPEVIAKAAEIAAWPTQEIEVEQKEDKPNRKNDNKKQTYDNKNNNFIKTGGAKKDEAKIAELHGYKPQAQVGVQITIGKNETLETRKIKDEIKNMAGRDFATLKEKEYQSMDVVEQAKKEIIYNLNLIVPENLKDIEKDIIKYLFEERQVCKVLIEEIIKKAWDQPKYASTYAKLCSDFCKRGNNEFKFEIEGKKEGKEGKEGKRDNPFKYYLIEKVQHSFDKKIEKFPEFESPEDKEAFLKDKKKIILSNVKFIAELILHKILKKRTIKYCISQLFESFFSHYYAFRHDNKIEDSVYDFHFEAIIEFIENIGELYEELGEKEKQGNYDFETVKNHISAILTLKSAPQTAILDQAEFFTGDEYFRLLEFINLSYIRDHFPRLSALLQNLVERRNNKWQKHLSAADGPKKLKEIQEDILKEEDDLQGKGKDKISKEKIEQEKLDKKVKELFEGWEMNKNEELREIKDILRKTAERSFYFSFLKQVADEKKDNIVKRVALFQVLLNGDRFNYREFKNAWFDIMKYLAIGSGDYPYCGAALAQVLQQSIQKEGSISDFYKKYNDDEEEDELFFLEEIFQKYYHYSKDEEVLKYVKPKAKLSGLI